MNDLTALSDDSVLRAFEDIRSHVTADVRSGGHRFMGEAAKKTADFLFEEIRRRGLNVQPISW